MSDTFSLHSAGALSPVVVKVGISEGHGRACILVRAEAWFAIVFGAKRKCDPPGGSRTLSTGVLFSEASHSLARAEAWTFMMRSRV